MFDKFGQVLLKLFTPLKNTADEEIQHLSIVFYSPITINTGYKNIVWSKGICSHIQYIL